MTDKYKCELHEAGVNLDSALNRFMGNEMLYAKFLRNFVQDESFQKLEESLKAKEIHDAFMYAHTMKGIVANLGIQSLWDILTPMAEQLRNEDPENIPDQQEILKRRYNEICNIINENQL